MGGIPQRPGSAQRARRPLHLRSRLSGQHRVGGKSRGLLPSRPFRDSATETVTDATGKAITVDLPIQVIDTPLPYDKPAQYAGASNSGIASRRSPLPGFRKPFRLGPEQRIARASQRTVLGARLGQDLGHEPAVGRRQSVPGLPGHSGGGALPVPPRELQVIIGGITYGPVCLGQTAPMPSRTTSGSISSTRVTTPRCRIRNWGWRPGLP